MSPKQEEDLIKIAKYVAKNSRIEDKEEAFSIALVGIAKGLNTYDRDKKVKLSTYLCSCAKFECWAEWRAEHRIKRGRDVKTISLDEYLEQGGQL